MKSRYILLAIFITAGIGSFVQLSSLDSAVQANPTLHFVATTVVTSVAGPALNAKYVGNKKCKMCHQKQFKSWKKSKKASAMDALKSGNFSDLKSKHGLDANKDYSRDEKCLACHTTGFGKTGGYFLADASDAKAAKKAKKLAGVGCESCHGPGGEYIKLHKKLLKSKGMYTQDEMYAAGMYKIQESVCITCHNSDNPTFDASKPFNFEERKQIGAHDHFPLKQRR